MAQIPYRGNTQSMTFPLLTDNMGYTVISPGQDQTYYPQVSPDGGSVVDRGIPSCVYAHNIMPSTYGWCSIGYTDLFSTPASGGPFNFDRTFYVEGAEIVADPNNHPEPLDARVYIALAKNNGVGVIYKATGTGQWSPIANGQPTIPSNCLITTAEINGFTYIYFSNVGCYVYNPLTDTLIERTLNSLEKTEIKGIVASNGYLLAYTDTSIAWSSSIDPEEFDPNNTDITGAGGGSVQEAKGTLVTARQTFIGFILYTTGNAVSVTYSGNENFPWNFKGIPSAGGVSHPDLVAQKELNTFQYAYTTYGMQQITHQKASTVLPHITDFFGRQVFEDFDVNTNTLSRTILTTPMRKKVSAVADRYLIISYGASPNEMMTHALVLDMTQNRTGKLRFQHNYVFERIPFNSAEAEIPKETISLLQQDGTSKIVNFSIEGVFNQDVALILGKFQMTRQRLTQLQEVEVDFLGGYPTYSNALLLPSSDGINFDSAQPLYGVQESDGEYYRFLYDGPATKSFSLLLKGAMQLNSYVLWLTLNGRF